MAITGDYTSFGRVAGTRKDTANKAMITIRTTSVSLHKTAIPIPIIRAVLMTLNTE
jgi:hypothetical protein